MDDRELLRLAAKAAGYAIKSTVVDECDPLIGLRLKQSKQIWNPLAEDGDAFRLAAMLNLSIITGWEFNGNPSGYVGAILGSHEDLRLTSTKYSGDPCAAWRRAIVLAAAEIGRSMP